MENRTESKVNLSVFTLCCFLLLIPCLFAWLVNLEIAIQLFDKEWKALIFLLPSRVFHIFKPLAADLSTISTLVPVLLLFFPLIQGLRIIWHTRQNPSFVHEIEWLPYPPRFAFFLIMLGLTGTLYGLLIGLSVSEIGSLVGHIPTTDIVSASLQRLLAGTATALLSSLVGLIGAFFAASPIPWLFRKVAHIEVTYEGEKSLTGIIETLTDDLQHLSAASRSFSARLKPKALDGLFKQLEGLETSHRELANKIDQANKNLGRLEDVQEQTKAIVASLQTLERTVAGAGSRLDDSNTCLKHMEQAQKETNALLCHLETLENATISLGTRMDHSNNHLSNMKEARERTNSLLELLLKDMQIQHQSNSQSLGSILETSLEYNRTAKRDRETVRRAFEFFVKGSTETKPGNEPKD